MDIGLGIGIPLTRNQTDGGIGAGVDNLLLEDGGNLLLEDGTVLKLE